MSAGVGNWLILMLWRWIRFLVRCRHSLSTSDTMVLLSLDRRTDSVVRLRKKFKGGLTLQRGAKRWSSSDLRCGKGTKPEPVRFASKLTQGSWVAR